MKKFYFFILFGFNYLTGFSQYATPNTGVTWNADSLVKYSSGAVTLNSGAYQIHQNLTISANDILEIITNDSVKIASGKLVTVNGKFVANPPSKLIFTAIDTTLNYSGFRFENSVGSSVKNTVFQFGGGNKVIGSEMNFENCTFRKNSASYASGALDIFQCSPIVENCTFTENQRSAVMSAANAQASPKILHNTVFHNSTANANYPQINLGNCASGKQTVIRGNIVTGFYAMAGGIAVSALAGGNVDCTIDSNTVKNNRYGIAALGYNINAVIADNVIENNNIQNIPAQGGSGINLNGDATNSSKLYRNTISGNLWGITLQGTVKCNMGCYYSGIEINIGQNSIFNNSNSGATYNLYNNTPSNQNANFNFWGSYNLTTIAQGIFDNSDNSALGTVYYDYIQKPISQIPYQTLGDSGTIWSVNLEKFALLGDTLVNSSTYKKIYWHIGYSTFQLDKAQYLAAVREDVGEKKIFMIPQNEIKESLLYDFSLKIGDTATVLAAPAWFFNPDFHSNFVQIFDIDSVNINGNYRKQFLLSQSNYPPFTENWIEGIGSDRGFLFPGEFYEMLSKYTPGYPTLLCYSEAGNLIYDPYIEFSCYEDVGGSVHNLNQNNQFKIYPTAASDQITVESAESADFSVEIYNVFGEKILVSENKNSDKITVNISNFSGGIYFVKVKGKNAEFSGKIIKM